MKPCFQGKGLLGGGSNCSSGHRPVQPVTRPENRAATDQIQRVVVRLLGVTFRTQGQHKARAASWTVLSDPGRQRTKSNARSCGCWVLRSERSASTASELDGLARPRVATDQIQRVVVRLLGRRFRRQRQHRQRVGRSCQTRRAVTTGVCNKIPVECSRADP